MMVLPEKPSPRAGWWFALALAAYSVFLGEVVPGSTWFPFFQPWGLVVVWPLYELHTLLLLTLVLRYRRGPLRFRHLALAGGLYALQEAYITKMFWRPLGEAWVNVGGLAVVDIGVLYWWHTWFSFITPVVLAEGLLTSTRTVLTALPAGLQRVYGSTWGWIGLSLFAAVVQAVYAPSVGRSLAAALGNLAVLALLTWLARRRLPRPRPGLEALLPGPRATGWLFLWLLAYYVLLGAAATPERLPAFWPAQAMVWGMYLLVGLALARALRKTTPAAPQGFRRVPGFPSVRGLLAAALVGAAAFPLATWVLKDAKAPALVLVWGLGLLMALMTGVWAFWEKG